MPRMGGTVREIARELGRRLEPLSRVVAAYSTFQPKTNTIHVTILVDDFDEETDRRITDIEAEIADTYEDYAFEFSVIHLCGRQPETFDPVGNPTRIAVIPPSSSRLAS